MGWDTYQREKREYQAHKLVDKLDMQQDFPSNRMVCLPDLTEMDQRIDSGEKCTIEPSSTLRDELWYSIYRLISVSNRHS